MSAADLALITGARGDRLFDASGRAYVDLNMGYGAVWLGHDHEAVVRVVRAQLDTYAAPGFLPHAAFDAAQAALAPFIPATHRLGGFYSTGMEAVETALRAARVHTGRHHVAGFAGSTHGRSALAAALGASEPTLPLPFVHRLPALSEPAPVLDRALLALVAQVDLAALVVEPVQMTNGGHAMDDRFADTLTRVARENSIALIFDETLTGLHRCGPRLWSDRLEGSPDIMVLGKGLANGLPASAVVLAQDFTWDRTRVKPGSTFYNHPLTCAAIGATLDALAALEPAQAAAAIEQVVRGELGMLDLRGAGALWSLAVPAGERQQAFVDRLLGDGIIVSYYPGYIRLLPPITVDLETLAGACRAIRQAHADTFR